MSFRRLLNCLTLLVVCLSLHLPTTAEVNAERVKFVRYPHVSNDGRLVFSYHGDIWITEADGGRPRRLTAHVARDTFPRFSPDGKWVAFNSDRMGNTDVWLVSAEGGTPRQLTFHSTSDALQYWTPDGKGVIVASSRVGTWGAPLFIVPLDGGIPTAMDMDRAAAGMIRQDGQRVAFNRTGFRYWRKHYRGNNNTDIWVQDLGTKQIQQLTDVDVKKFRSHTQDAYPMWGADGMIYFMSERDGIFNIWKISAEGGKPVQVTQHKADGVQYPSISPDGKTLVYENEFELWKLSVEGGNPVQVPIDLAFDPKDNLVELLEREDQADAFSPSPDGKSVAVEIHGEIFLVPGESGQGEMTRVTHSAWRDRLQGFSPDGKHLAYLSDQSGDDEIWVYSLDQAKPKQVTTHPSLKGDITWSPDSQRIAFTADSKILEVQLESGELSELIHNPEGGFRSLAYSSDGAWLVYSRSNQDLNSEVYLFHREDRKEYNVTASRFTEFGNVLTADGQHVVFASDRSGEYQIYAVPLQPRDQDPDDPLADQSAASTDESNKEGEKPTESDGEATAQQQNQEDSSAKEGEAVRVEPNLHRIYDRARPLTSGSDGISRFIASKDGKTIYFTRGNSLYAVDVKSEKQRKVTDGSFSRLTLSQDGRHFFYQQGSDLYRMTTKGSDKKKVGFKIRMKIDLVAQWEQIFEESWRVMKYRFYDEKMHGFDWEAIRQRYRPLLAYVGENQDLYDLCNEMIGELNASHTGVSGPDSREMPTLNSTRHLGFEMASDGEYFRVTEIIPNGPADKEWLELKVGDVVLEVEGQQLRGARNYVPLLNDPLNDYVDLQVATPGEAADPQSLSLGPKRHLRIKHVSSVGNLRYEAWVEGNRKFVDEQSQGKVGYVHIRSMNRSSLERFRTEINQFWNKNGMIVDIRYNGGGNIDQELIDILERKPYEYWNYRLGGRAQGRRPRQAIAGPKVMLINWRSASDSEVTPQAFRDLKLGRIVGNPTYGAVIATGSYRLINGARIRTPGSLVVTYDPTKPHNYGINLENFGVAPDVWVENSPQDELDGFDRELKTAVDEALKMLSEGTWQFGEDD